jgi:hypothetical protein
MARRFDQLFNSMSDVRSELKAEAKALFKNLYNTLRRTVRTNQQLANSLKVSLNLPPMALVLLVELPALKETKRSLRDRIFTNITWTSTRRIREDFLAKAQNTLKQMIKDDKRALRKQIRQQSNAALASFKSTLHQITTQFEYCAKPVSWLRPGTHPAVRRLHRAAHRRRQLSRSHPSRARSLRQVVHRLRWGRWSGLLSRPHAL